MQSGQFTTSGSGPTRVTFPIPYASPPNVQCTVLRDGDGQWLLPHVNVLTATGCDFGAIVYTGAGWGGGHTLLWRAEGIPA